MVEIDNREAARRHLGRSVADVTAGSEGGKKERKGRGGGTNFPWGLRNFYSKLT